MEPIKDKDIIEKIKLNLKENNLRNYMIFLIGINTGMKTKNLLKLEVLNIYSVDGNIKSEIEIDGVNYIFSEFIKKSLEEYFLSYNLYNHKYLFPSKKGKDNPINRSHLYRILNNTGYEYKIGNETLRKTYGYHFYNETHDFNRLKYIFKKKSKNELIQYLGLDVVDDIYEFKL